MFAKQKKGSPTFFFAIRINICVSKIESKIEFYKNYKTLHQRPIFINSRFYNLNKLGEGQRGNIQQETKNR